MLYPYTRPTVIGEEHQVNRAQSFRVQMRNAKFKMKSVLCISLLVISSCAIASAERKSVSSGQWAVGRNPKTVGSKQKAVGRIETRLPDSSTRRPQTSRSRAQTREAERKLSELGYWTGPVDGVLDPATRSALIAFQKWEGRPITGKLTLEELEAIRNGMPPKARELGYAHVEVDLDRQVLLIVSHDGGMANDDGERMNNDGGAASYVGRRDGRGDGVLVLPISSGSGKPFVDEGQMSVAHTPRGRFLVYDKVEGWEQGAFRGMYYSNYISGGVAIHGYESVPIQPESHGCIRIPLFAAPEVSKLLPIGTIVLVYDKVSFVSGKPWAENPKLKQAILDWNRTVGN
jgi:N-acetylmuramoyl-L-alanine amidase